jgi:hypothetical protein
MTYSRIFAPIDGLVVSRNIDPGQTVAASFQAPTLFVIAEDLRRMRILAEIDEADVGKLKEGMKAEATVDAFSGEIFQGKVSQVRYNPNSVQGVVTYLAVVDVENPDMKLRPGMTATVTVKTREVKGVLRLPNAALRYRPTPPNRIEAAKEGVEFKPEPPPEPLAHGKGRIYVLTDTTSAKNLSRGPKVPRPPVPRVPPRRDPLSPEHQDDRSCDAGATNRVSDQNTRSAADADSRAQQRMESGARTSVRTLGLVQESWKGQRLTLRMRVQRLGAYTVIRCVDIFSVATPVCIVCCASIGYCATTPSFCIVFV